MSPTYDIPCADDFSSEHVVNHHSIFCTPKTAVSFSNSKDSSHLIDKDTVLDGQ